MFALQRIVCSWHCENASTDDAEGDEAFVFDDGACELYVDPRGRGSATDGASEGGGGGASVVAYQPSDCLSTEPSFRQRLHEVAYQPGDCLSNEPSFRHSVQQVVATHLQAALQVARSVGQLGYEVAVVTGKTGLEATESALAGCLIVSSVPLTLVAAFPMALYAGGSVVLAAWRDLSDVAKAAILAAVGVNLGVGLYFMPSPLTGGALLLNLAWNLALPFTSRMAACVSLSVFMTTMHHARCEEGVLPFVRPESRERDLAIFRWLGALSLAAVVAPEALVVISAGELAGTVNVLGFMIAQLSNAFTTGLWINPAVTLEVAGVVAGIASASVSAGLFATSTYTRLEAFTEGGTRSQRATPRCLASHGIDCSATTGPGVLERLLTSPGSQPAAVLGIHSGEELTEEAINRAFRQTSLIVHPDKCADKERATAAFHKLEAARQQALEELAA